MQTTPNTRHVYRLPPCPAYDVEGTQSWLEELAQEGLFLASDGFFAGFAILERRAPQKVRYRLQAAQKEPNLWSEQAGEPDPEEVALCAAYTWEYVARRGDFFFYRSTDTQAPELHSDPAVQALALRAVRRRMLLRLFRLAFWTVLYPLLKLHGGIWMLVAAIGSWCVGLLVLVVLWELIHSAAAVLHLGRLQRRLRLGKPDFRRKSWQQRAVGYHLEKIMRNALFVLLLCVLLRQWSRHVLGEDRIALADYTEAFPFATMTDFAEQRGETVTQYQAIFSGGSFQTVLERHDPLITRTLSYQECARLLCASGHILEGSLSVDYYETASAPIAARLLLENFRYDRRQKGFAAQETPSLAADEVLFYTDRVHIPTLLLRKENICVRVRFQQYASSDLPPLSSVEWSRIVLESLPPAVS